MRIHKKYKGIIHPYSLFVFMGLLLSINIYASTSFKPQLQLATSFNDDQKNTYIIDEYWISEKLDGVRGYWDGKALFTKKGNPIQAPKWFTKNWPKIPLDGELWIARQKFEQSVSCVRQSNKNHQCWQSIRFMLFDLPNSKDVFTQRIITMQQIIEATNNNFLQMVVQTKATTLKAMYQQLNDVIKHQGEGLMLHHQQATYYSGRVKHLLKVKKKYDAEATVIEHIPGKGKFSGMLGAIKVQTEEGVTFKIGSGFSHIERKSPPAIGSIITYQYLGKTQRGIPRFATFLRIRDE